VEPLEPLEPEERRFQSGSSGYGTKTNWLLYIYLTIVVAIGSAGSGGQRSCRTSALIFAYSLSLSLTSPLVLALVRIEDAMRF
jgi:hypothetical protein